MPCSWHRLAELSVPSAAHRTQEHARKRAFGASGEDDPPALSSHLHGIRVSHEDGRTAPEGHPRRRPRKRVFAHALVCDAQPKGPTARPGGAMNMAYPGYSLVIDGSSARSPKDSRAL